MNENIEQLNSKFISLRSNPLLWTQASDVTNQIEQLNGHDEADPYDRLAQVQILLEELEHPGIFTKGRRTIEAVFVILAVAQAISAVTWDRFLGRAAEERTRASSLLREAAPS